MGYTVKQKMDICWKAEAHPQMTQSDLALWAMKQYGSAKPPSQTTISRILGSKNELIASSEAEFSLVRRRKQSNPILRRILTEWITQATWERIPITTPIIQSTANAIWTRLPSSAKDGNKLFNLKWCNHFLRKLNINVSGTALEQKSNPGGYRLDKVWKLDDKIELKQYIQQLIHAEKYQPQDIFTIDEFQLFYSLPLDQIFDVSSVDKGLKQTAIQTPANSLTIMLGCNVDGSEKLPPLVVGSSENFDVSQSSSSLLNHLTGVSKHSLMNKITEVYNLSYKCNTNKWLTSSMFQNYLRTLEHKLTNISPNRKIVILVDDSSSHRIINLSFKNIRLCFLKNNSNHKNPYQSSYGGIKFDYLPMSYGIVDEFKILYRLQQYMEMISVQRRKSEKALEVLSESDYTIPLIKVIEWIRSAWSGVSPEKIFMAWRKTNLLGEKYGPRIGLAPSTNEPMSELHPSLVPLAEKCRQFNPNGNYMKLERIMTHLNVVIPWEIDELLGLVNERVKITLSYVSIEEIIGSCLTESNSATEVDDFDAGAREDERARETAAVALTGASPGTVASAGPGARSPRTKWYEDALSKSDLLSDSAFSAMIDRVAEYPGTPESTSYKRRMDDIAWSSCKKLSRDAPRALSLPSSSGVASSPDEALMSAVASLQSPVDTHAPAAPPPAELTNALAQVLDASHQLGLAPATVSDLRQTLTTLLSQNSLHS